MQPISERIILTIWVGGMWVIGYIVAPTLFAMIDDRALAGSTAGRLFMIMSYIGIFSAGFLLLTAFMRYSGRFIHEWRVWLLGLVLSLILIGEFILQPQMAALRDGGILDTEKATFGLLHGIASVLFLMTSVSGLVLVIFGLERKNQ